MNIKHIAVLPGDGVGSEVMHAALPILTLVNLPIKLQFGEIGWACWQKEGTPIPVKTWELINRSEIALLGAITSKPHREALAALPIKLQKNPPIYLSPIIQLRHAWDLFANVRPCFSFNKKDNFNFCIIRENTEGLYSGFDFYPLPPSLKELIEHSPRWKKMGNNEISCSLRLQSKSGLLRIFEYAFQYAHRKKMSRVTFADKPNVLRRSSAFAREIFESIAERYPNIQADILNVDAVALWLIRRPQEFGVIVAENMFADILSDVGAGVMGGLGLAPSANIGNKKCYFEPVHGSGPNIPKNTANPSAMFLSIAMMLEHLGFAEDAQKIKQAVIDVINKQQSVTYDLGGKSGTNEMAHAIIEYFQKLK